jgi:Tfp pilus assembly protein PilV
MPSRSERGLTLTEVTIVTVLASLVMLGIVSFYVNSQGTWMDASSQAITQREATALVEDIRARVHTAARAEVADDGAQLELFEHGSTNPSYVYWWNASGECQPSCDSLVHEGSDRVHDRGPSVSSTVERFDCSRSDSLVELTLVLRTAQGQDVEVATRIAMLNRQ